MAQPSDALDGNDGFLPGDDPAVAEGVEDGRAGAEEGSCGGGVGVEGDARDGFVAEEAVFRVTAIHGDAVDGFVGAVLVGAFDAGGAGAVVAWGRGRGGVNEGGKIGKRGMMEKGKGGDGEGQEG